MMNVHRELLKKYKVLGGAFLFALACGFFWGRVVSYQPSALERVRLYAVATTCGSLPVTQFADAEGEVKVRWEAGVMDYSLALKDQSGTMAKWISEHPKGDFYIDWLNANETSFRRLTIPFKSFAISGSTLQADGHSACSQDQYAKVYERSAYWGLSWNTHAQK